MSEESTSSRAAHADDDARRPQVASGAQVAPTAQVASGAQVAPTAQVAPGAQVAPRVQVAVRAQVTPASADTMRRAAFVLGVALGSLGGACAAKAPEGFADPVDASVDAPRDATVSPDALPPRDTGADARSPSDDAQADAAAVIDAAPDGETLDAAVDGPSCPVPCGAVDQCGCASASTCDIGEDGGVACVPAGMFPRGAGCTTTSACSRGLTCSNGTCHEICGTPDAGCANGGRCVAGDRGGGSPPPNLLTCEANCELSDPDACPAGADGITDTCVLDDRTQGADCIGFPAAAISTPGGSCSSSAVCPPAHVCTVPSSGAPQGVCHRWCRVGGQDCAGCVAFTPAIVRNGSSYGYCP